MMKFFGVIGVILMTLGSITLVYCMVRLLMLAEGVHL